MGDIALAIQSKLTADSGVFGIMGNRLYPDWDRQSDRVYPLAVYKLELSPVVAFDGPTGANQGVVRIAAIGSKYGDAVALAAAVESALEGQSGTWGGVVVQGCFVQDNGITDDVVTDPTSQEILVYVRNIAFDLFYNS